MLYGSACVCLPGIGLVGSSFAGRSGAIDGPAVAAFGTSKLLTRYSSPQKESALPPRCQNHYPCLVLIHFLVKIIALELISLPRFSVCQTC